jgi:hypothetical protein
VAGASPEKKRNWMARAALYGGLGMVPIAAGAATLAGGSAINRLQQAQEESTGATPLYPPSFVGPGRVA